MSRSQKPRPVVEAFYARLPHKVVNNVGTDGNTLIFHGNVIAEWRGDRLFVRVNGFGPMTVTNEVFKRYNSTADGREYLKGNYEKSPCTLTWLSMIPGVSVCRQRCKLMLNGKVWDGQWTDVTRNEPATLATVGVYKADA